jgi:anti-sigma regulatory factor (Ser/Thr protein kinase)
MIDYRLRASDPGAFTREIANLVDGLASQAGLDSHDAYRLRLAADEITTNIAMHGYRGSGGIVEITGGLDQEWVWLRIEDAAPKFDPTGWESSAYRPADPVDGPIGGHGLFLALRSLDNFAYDYVNGRNRNLLRIRRSTPDGGPGGQDERAGGR